MRICGRDIIPGRTLIIAESGINHDGSIDDAMAMVELAHKCGADVVKFQKRDLETLYTKAALERPSEHSHSVGVYMQTLRRCELTKADHAKLFGRCRELGIGYMCSPWDIPSAVFLQELGVEAWKVPSACLSDIHLVEFLAATDKPVIISTGMHDGAELQALLAHYKGVLGENMAVLHCVSSYPTAERDVNLGVLADLAKLTGAPVGYSGHERGVPVTLAAVAMGARIVERHFTLDRTRRGPDHAASLEPHGLETLVRHIRAIEQALGNAKTVNRGEMMARETIGKALRWARDHSAGAPITQDSFCAKSPGYGISPASLLRIREQVAHGQSLVASRTVLADDLVAPNDIAEARDPAKRLDLRRYFCGIEGSGVHS